MPDTRKNHNPSGARTLHESGQRATSRGKKLV